MNNHTGMPPRGGIAFDIVRRVRGGRPHSVLCSVAYIARAQVYCGEHRFDFTERAGDLVVAELLRPADAPAWSASAVRLFRSMELVETAPDARLARELVLDLPAGLDAPAMWRLVRDFVRAEMVERVGMPVLLAVHEPARVGRTGPPHAHLLQPLRRLEPWGAGAVETAWNKDALHAAWRDAWRQRCSG